MFVLVVNQLQHETVMLNVGQEVINKILLYHHLVMENQPALIRLIGKLIDVQSLLPRRGL